VEKKKTEKTAKKQAAVMSPPLCFQKDK